MQSHAFELNERLADPLSEVVEAYTFFSFPRAT